MKLSKLLVVSIILQAVILGFSIQVQAGLQLIGTARYLGTDYNLIYDNDSQLTWLDYRNSDDWANQVSWASGLNGAGVLTYNLNAGISMNWSDDWRLPTTVDGPPWDYGYDGTTTAGYNITNSEMGHLFYAELGNLGYRDTSGTYQPGHGLTNTGDFQNLRSSLYWSGTESAYVTGVAWTFSTFYGDLQTDDKWNELYAMAVRPGDVTVFPEPISSTLFIIGAGVLAGRRCLRRKK